MSWYLLVKFIHVLLAITAVGSNITYGVWNTLAAREPANLAFTLKGISFIDRRVANPAYGLLLITGLIMVAIQGGWQGWIVTALILFVLLIVVAVGFYSPALRQQIQVLGTEGPTSAAYKRAERQSRLYGTISGLIALAIVFVMVVKPFR
jgi:uncharacterized membrane protein